MLDRREAEGEAPPEQYVHHPEVRERAVVPALNPVQSADPVPHPAAFHRVMGVEETYGLLHQILDPVIRHGCTP